VQALLPSVDVFMPNEPEALRIADKSDLDQAVDQLHALGMRLATVKRGAQGALVSDGQQVIRRGVAPVTGGDSIGAGDSFDAGFLAGWLRGLSLEESLRIGSVCGRSVAAQAGGLRGQPRWEEIGGQ
jgi:sugar/nucleoside kinase (ribokinase family)